MKQELWNVYRVFYMTYAEIDACGDKPRQLVKGGLTFDAAKRMVESLGFGYSMHPASAG